MSLRVLVVDDEEAIVAGLTCLLDSEAIESRGAFDRLSAESMIGETFYAVIVADLRLHTEAEGLELLDGIRRISPRSRVVTLTGYSTPEMTAEVLRRGSAMVIKKPAGSEEILGAINALLAEVEKLADSQEVLDPEQLYFGLRRLLHSIPIKRFGLTPEESEEVVQQAWLLFLEKRSLIRTAKPWMIGTVSNLCKQQIGLAYRRRESFVGDEVLAELPDKRSGSADTSIALRQALAGLDHQSRSLCIHIAIEGHSYEEVSAMMALPIGSIGPMYLRAKSKMRMKMAA
ncbi:MAG: two-component system, NtrC family, response regulator [Thermoanaerobaculia bacterium]|jgi:RNA polymerase sigma factor (sigma-70 family)|nr:two-component system, NtrC family, response regulator [Thermoanaerobaculia bacterium]